MSTGTIISTANVAGKAVSSQIVRTANLDTGYDGDVLPAGKAGTLTTRTDDDTGVITVAEGHEITDSDTVDVFWVGGSRYGVDVTATDGTTVSIDAGDGTNLPAQDFAVVVTKQVTIDVDFDGDNVEMIVVSNSKRVHLDFQEGGGTSILPLDIPANEGWFWCADQGVANPLTGNATGQIKASSGEAADATLKIALLYDS